VLEFLVDIKFEMKEERRKLIRDLCVSAYPDIQPWQVRQACLENGPRGSKSTGSRIPCSDDCMEDLYYTYLSNLLNPMDGHETARHNPELVKEYCEWSVGIHPTSIKNPERMENFFKVASRTSIQYKRYKRDLMMLLDLSVIVDKGDLVLELGKLREDVPRLLTIQFFKLAHHVTSLSQCFSFPHYA
jgi:hypothetical protein